jgi:hypothetical protein
VLHLYGMRTGGTERVAVSCICIRPAIGLSAIRHVGSPLLFDILRHVVQCSAVKSYRKPAITRILPP